MEHYKLAETKLENVDKSDLTFASVPDDAVWMQVKPNSRVHNMVGFAKSQLQTHSCVLWSGSGQAVSKTLLSAELLKKSVKELHQLTHCCYQRATELWKPKENPALDTLQVNKDIPSIHILLSKSAIDSQNDSYQAPEDKSVPFGRVSRGVDSATTTTTTQTKKPNLVHTAMQFCGGGDTQQSSNVFKRTRRPRRRPATAGKNGANEANAQQKST